MNNDDATVPGCCLNHAPGADGGVVIIIIDNALRHVTPGTAAQWATAPDLQPPEKEEYQWGNRASRRNPYREPQYRQPPPPRFLITDRRCRRPKGQHRNPHKRHRK